MKKILLASFILPACLFADGLFEASMTDKETHFCFGAVCAYSALLLDNFFFYDESKDSLRRTVVGLLAAFAGGGLKELWDSAGKGTVDAMDFWTTVGGGCAGVLGAISADCLADQPKTWYSVLYGGTAALFAIPIGVYMLEAVPGT